MSAFFRWRHFPLKTQNFSKIFFFIIFKFIKEKNEKIFFFNFLVHTQYQKSSYYGNFG